MWERCVWTDQQTASCSCLTCVLSNWTTLLGQQHSRQIYLTGHWSKSVLGWGCTTAGQGEGYLEFDMLVEAMTAVFQAAVGLTASSCGMTFLRLLDLGAGEVSGSC